MTKLTIRKSSRPLKRKPSTPPCSNSKSPALLVPKRVKKGAKPVPSKTSITPTIDDDSDLEIPVTCTAPLKDVSGEIFTIQKSCMMGLIAITQDSDFVVLGEFSYRQFEVSSIRKLTKASEVANTTFEWLSGKALISSKSCRVSDNLSIEVDDESGWRKVEKGVERWMLQNKKEIIVKLTVVYRKVGGTAVESSEDESPTSKKGPKSRTEKLVKKAQEQGKIDTQHIDDIILRWGCGQTTCPNERGFCYVVDGIHLRMLAQHMKIWSMAINEDEGDIDTMPTALAKTLMPAKTGTKNPLRENSAGKPATSQDGLAAPHLTFPPHTPVPYYQHPTGYYGPYNGSYPQLGYPPPPPQVASSPKRPPRRHDRSSSLPSEFDSCVDKLMDYIVWLIKRYPTKSEQLTTCRETLQSKDIVYETLDTIDNTLWESWNVSDGIRLMVKSHQRKWEHAKAKDSR